MATKLIGGSGYIDFKTNGDVTGAPNKFIGGSCLVSVSASASLLQTVGSKILSGPPCTASFSTAGDFRYTTVSAVSGQAYTTLGLTGALGVAIVSAKTFSGTTSISTGTAGAAALAQTFAGSTSLGSGTQGDINAAFSILSFSGSANVGLSSSAGMRLAARFQGSIPLRLVTFGSVDQESVGSLTGTPIPVRFETTASMTTAGVFLAVVPLRLTVTGDMRVKFPLHAYPYFRGPVVRDVGASYTDPAGRDYGGHYADVPQPINKLMSRYQGPERGVNLFIMMDGSVTEQQPPNWNPNDPTGPISQGWNPFTHELEAVYPPLNEQVRRVIFGGTTVTVTLEEATLLDAAGYGDYLTTEAA